MKPPDEKLEASTRQRVAEAAAALFSQQGFARTTIRQICSAAGITAPTLYYHFESKDGLIREIASETLRLFVRDVQSLDEGASLDEALHALSSKVFRFGEERPASIRLIAQLDTTPLPDALREEIAGLQQESTQSIVALFDRAVVRNEIPHVDTQYCAESFVGLAMFQLAARGQAGSSVESVEDSAARLARFMKAGALGAPPAQGRGPLGETRH